MRFYVHQVHFVVLTDSMVSSALHGNYPAPIFCETGLPCVLAFSLSLSLSLAFTSFMMAIISSGHELSLLRACKGREEGERRGEEGERGRRGMRNGGRGEEGRRGGERDEESSISYCCQGACDDSMTHSPQAASVHH